MQCVVAHQPGQCPRKINKNLPIGCVNCGEHKLNFAGHTANNFRECGYFKSISNGKIFSEVQNKTKRNIKNVNNGNVSYTIGASTSSGVNATTSNGQGPNKPKK